MMTLFAALSAGKINGINKKYDKVTKTYFLRIEIKYEEDGLIKSQKP